MTLRTEGTNEDKIVLKKLGSFVTTSFNDVDEDDYAILVEHRYLVDERNLQLLIDLKNPGLQSPLDLCCELPSENCKISTNLNI